MNLFRPKIAKKDGGKELTRTLVFAVGHRVNFLSKREKDPVKSNLLFICITAEKILYLHALNILFVMKLFIKVSMMRLT